MGHHVVVRGGGGVGVLPKQRDNRHRFPSSKKGVHILLKQVLRLKNKNIISLN